MFAGAAREAGQGAAGLAAGVGGDDERDAERLRAGEAHAHGGEQEAPGWCRVCSWKLEFCFKIVDILVNLGKL